MEGDVVTESERLEDVMRLAPKMQEGGTGQGLQVREGKKGILPWSLGKEPLLLIH